MSLPEAARIVRAIQVRIGVPKATGEVFAAAPGPLLLSAGALWDPAAGRFRAPPVALWNRDVALDSGGFVAMMRGGYRWTVEQYVDLVVRGRALAARPDDRDDDLGGFGPPWSWWSAMDYCCEPEIASNRAEVERRMALTVERYVDCLGAIGAWRDEGVTDTPDPMPILQGRTPEDYVRSAEELARRTPGGAGVVLALPVEQLPEEAEQVGAHRHGPVTRDRDGGAGLEDTDDGVEGGVGVRRWRLHAPPEATRPCGSRRQMVSPTPGRALASRRRSPPSRPTSAKFLRGGRGGPGPRARRSS